MMLVVSSNITIEVVYIFHLFKIIMFHKLNFGNSNAKLKEQRTATFSLPAGYTCPGAKDCHAWFNREEGKLHDGKYQEYRCYAASSEASYPAVRASVDHNLALLKAAGTVEKMAQLIDLSIPKTGAFDFIRVHQNGDFFNGSYFMAWMEVARRNPDMGFYAYTKSIPTWVKYRSLVPSNFALTASIGGKFDALAAKHKLRTARVVFHPEEAEDLGLEIDHDDSHARNPKGGDFALLIHNYGPPGSKQNLALKRMKAENIQFSYGRKGTPNKSGPAKTIRKTLNNRRK